MKRFLPLLALLLLLSLLLAACDEADAPAEFDAPPAAEEEEIAAPDPITLPEVPLYDQLYMLAEHRREIDDWAAETGADEAALQAQYTEAYLLKLDASIDYAAAMAEIYTAHNVQMLLGETRALYASGRRVLLADQAVAERCVLRLAALRTAINDVAEANGVTDNGNLTAMFSAADQAELAAVQARIAVLTEAKTAADALLAQMNAFTVIPGEETGEDIGAFGAEITRICRTYGLMTGAADHGEILTAVIDKKTALDREHQTAEGARASLLATLTGIAQRWTVHTDFAAAIRAYETYAATYYGGEVPAGSAEAVAYQSFLTQQAPYEAEVAEAALAAGAIKSAIAAWDHTAVNADNAAAASAAIAEIEADMAAYRTAYGCDITACTVCSGIGAAGHLSFLKVKAKAANVLRYQAFLAENADRLRVDATGVSGKAPAMMETFQAMLGNASAKAAVESADAFAEAAFSGYETDLGAVRVITLSADTALTDVYTGSLGGGCIILGTAQGVRLILPETVSVSGNLLIKDLTLVGASTVYANGHRLIIEETVLSADKANRLTVYGGSNGKAVSGTDLQLLGGYYQTVYGGGNGAAGKVNGDTHLLFGGNANKEDTADDNGVCTLWGGGNGGAVTGSAYVTVTGNASTKYVSGTGSGTEGAKVTSTHILVSGGKIMNVFGGSRNAAITQRITTNITVTGGVVESVFGGCSGKDMKGDAYITLLGGEITRRVYTGCYNDADVPVLFGSVTWKSSAQVDGKTTLSIGAGVKLATGKGLSFTNKTDMGVYGGSRYADKMEKETNVIIFLEGCYESMNEYIGPASGSLKNICQSHHDEIVKEPATT